MSNPHQHFARSSSRYSEYSVSLHESRYSPSSCVNQGSLYGTQFYAYVRSEEGRTSRPQLRVTGIDERAKSDPAAPIEALADNYLDRNRTSTTDVTCFGCGQVGHYQTNCPRRWGRLRTDLTAHSTIDAATSIEIASTIVLVTMSVLETMTVPMQAIVQINQVRRGPDHPPRRIPP